MSKRLEEIKGNFKKGYPFTSRAVREIQILEDFKWLIEQAERVEKLEKENKLLRFIAEENKIAYEQRVEQIKRYREALQSILDYNHHELTIPLDVIEVIEKELEGEE